jgi:hypothetical protein
VQQNALLTILIIIFQPIQLFYAIWVFETKSGQIGITNLQLIDYQYFKIIVFLQQQFLFWQNVALYLDLIHEIEL